MKKSARQNTTRPPARAIRSSSLIDLVRRNALFSKVGRKAIERLASKLREHRFQRGETIFDEKTRGRDLYLILAGKVHIKKYTKYGTESLLGVLHERDFFGELSLIGGFPRSARAEAATDCHIVRLGYDHYQSLLTESRSFTQNLLQHLAVRLRTLDQMFVSELERHAQAFGSQMEKLHRLIEASKVVNSAIDSDRLLERILSAATESIRADRGTLYLIDQATGELWSKVSNGKNLVEIRLPMGKGLAGYVAKTGEVINITDAYKDPRFNPEIDKRSGYKTRNVLCMPLRDKGGKIVGVFQLLNKRGGTFSKEDEEFIDALSVHAAIAIENANLVRELVQNERLSAIGRMASTIIHDIKNPMATMRIYAQVIKNKAENAEAADIATKMINEVDRFVNMTQEVLDFSRGITELNLETVQLSELLPSIVAFIDPDLARRGIKLKKEFRYTGAATIDSEKMMRVFLNIAGNAADAMPQGGTFTLRSDKTDNRIVLEFIDTGIGMSDEVRFRAFEPFFTRGKKHGTGLGLAIVKKIVDDHKGTVEIDSEPKRGTGIRIVLPIQ